MPAGRPLSLDQRRRDAIAELLGYGVPVKTAATACGVPLRTLTRWLTTGAVTRPLAPTPLRLGTEPPLPQRAVSFDEILEELPQPLDFAL